MNPNENAYRQLKQWQKALKLTDDDTGLGEEDPLQPTSPKREDLKLYEELLAEALQRHFPLRESDRKELEYYRQVFHIPQEQSSEIEQRILDQMQLPTDSEDSTDEWQPLNDPLFETSIPANTPTQPSNAPTRGATAPTVQNKKPSANRAAVSGTVKHLFENNQAMGVGQTLPPNDLPKRSPFETKSPEPTEKSVTDAASPSSPSPAPVTTIADPQGSAPQTTGQPPAGHPLTTISNSPHTLPQESQQAPPVEAAAARTPPNTIAVKEETSSPPATASTAKKSSIDKRIVIPLITLLCGITAFIVIAWMARSSLLEPRDPDPQAAEQLVKVGVEKNQQGAHQEAINNFNDALRFDPDALAAYINRGYAYHQVGNLNAAVDDYNQAIKLDPNSAIAHNNLSHVQYDQKKYNEALQSAQQAITLKRDLAEAHLNMGNALLALDKPTEALQKFQETLQLSAIPATHAKAYNNIGNIYAARNQLEEARKHYDQALQRDSNYADASYNRGMVFERLENRAAAIQDFANAATLYENQRRDRLSEQAKRRAEQLQQGSSPQPTPSTNPNQKSI